MGMKTVRIWLAIQFPEAPFTTEMEIASVVQTRKDFESAVVEAIERVRDDAERIEVRCICWEQTT